MLEAELLLEILEVAEVDELSLVEEGAEDLGLLQSSFISWHWVDIVPDDSGGDHHLVPDSDGGCLLQGRFGPVLVDGLVSELF